MATDTIPSPEALAAEARRLLEAGQPGKAAAAARAALAGAPGDRDLAYLLAVATRYAGDPAGALVVLDALLADHGGYARAHQERGHALLALGDHPAAMVAYQNAVALNAALVASWRALAGLHQAAGQAEAADHAKAQFGYLTALPPPLLGVADMTQEGKLARAEELARAFLQANPGHVEGMRLLADLGQRFQVLDEAEFLLESAVLIEPANIPARYDYTGILAKRQKHAAALEQATILRAAEPGNPRLESLWADQNLAVGNFDEALGVYAQRAATQPANPSFQLTLGHVLKTVGRQDEAVAAYRAAYAARPDFGDAFWSLANLKTYRFSDDEIAAMRAREADPATRLVDRYHLCFALGKALEDRRDFAEAFFAYERGNRLKREEVGYDWRKIAADIQLQVDHVDAALFDRFAGAGCPDAAPIFIVGLPRAGSTLLEQILSSHSMVEGTMELPNVIATAHRIDGRRRVGEAANYPGNLDEQPPERFRELGEAFIADTMMHRKRGAPYFIDKMPNNFRHIGLIHLMLPNAKIIDARRSAMGCCFSGFKQLFAEGQEFTYGLEEVGHYYRDYVRLMDHWDSVLPGKILRMTYEDVVADLETQVRRMLDFLGLPFEDACLAFHKTERAVRTASSEQVRQPLYKSGVDQWENFSAWLDPLRAVLGPDLAR